MKGLQKTYGFATLLILLLASLLIHCDGFKYEKKDDSIRESLKPMPWYDHPPDDYKKYETKDFKDLLKKKEKETAPWWSGLFNIPLPVGFVNIFIYLLIAILIAVALFFLFQLYRTRNKSLGDKLKIMKEAAIIHRDLIEHLIEPDAALESDLKKKIRQLLAAKDYRKAVLYMFLFTLIEIVDRGLLQLRPQFTAREYARALARNRNVNASLLEVFRRVAQAFEIAAYRLVTPEEDPEKLWLDIQQELG